MSKPDVADKEDSGGGRDADGGMDADGGEDMAGGVDGKEQSGEVRSSLICVAFSGVLRPNIFCLGKVSCRKS